MSVRIIYTIIKIKNKFEIKKSNNIFLSFNIRNFEIPKYRSFHIWLFQMYPEFADVNDDVGSLTGTCSDLIIFLLARDFIIALYKSS